MRFCMEKFLKLSLCTSCTACASACPKNCITMVPDADGFCYPVVDETACVECGLCVRACPLLSEQKPEHEPTAWAARSRDTEMRLQSSSGGVFTELARLILAQSGAVFSESTGAVSIRAVFNNRNHLLRNGGSGTIIIPTTLHNAIVIPQSATYELQDRVFVYKVVDGKASSTEIHIAPQNNGVEYIVTDGLEVGDIIVAEGAGLIKEGTAIKSKNELHNKQTEE